MLPARRSEVERPQPHYMRWPGVPSYSLRMRAAGTAWPMIVHMVDRAWAAGQDGRFVHTPFEEPCRCGKSISSCEVRQTLHLAREIGYQLPLEARALRAYAYKLQAAGFVAGVARLPAEAPLFITTLHDDLVVVTGARLRDSAVAQGTCSRCRASDCAHIEAAHHAHAHPADLVRPIGITSDVIPGLLLYAEVERYPQQLGYVGAMIIDWQARKAKIKELIQQSRAQMAAQQHEIRAALIEHLRAEKEAKGETLDMSELKTESDVGTPDQDAPRTKWDHLKDPDTGHALILSSVDGDLFIQGLRSPTACDCGTSACVHERLIARMNEAPEVDREAGAEREAKAAQEGEAARQKKQSTAVPSGATGGRPGAIT